MAKSDKELKPLLDKSSTSQQQQHHSQEPHQHQKNNNMKHGIKGKTSSKPKLFSVSETSVEEASSKEERHGLCSEKDVDESEAQKMKQKKSTTQSTLSPHPPHHHGSCGELSEEAKAAQSFGVKSYLHHFYESVSQTPTQEENYQYLIHPKSTPCGAIWFKIGLIIGATLFLLGAVAIVIGYAIPKQRVIMGISENIEIIDNDARRFNENLDRCKLIGLAGFCSGGLILVISLLAPTFTSTYWEDDPATEPFRVSLSSHILGHVIPIDSASEPNQSPIPVTEKIKCIQPVWTD
ncbi:unnamed protein product [Orchesella dallaii]|uniref:Neurensin-1 n=1 Tax=Orchesella dallaii TaxID=48710 RepID=A0ABP1Q2M7_9HEXA